MAWYNPKDWSGSDWRNVALGAGVGVATGGLGTVPMMLGSGALGGLAGKAVGDVTGIDPLGSLGGIFDSGEQKTTQEPWAPQQPYLKDLFAQSQNLYNQGGPLAPGTSPLTQQYLSGLPGAYQQSQNLLNPASSYLSSFGMGQGSPLDMSGLQSTAAGDFMGSNPYLDDMYQQGAEDISRSFKSTVLPEITSMFAGSKGAFGSGAHQNLLGDATRNLGSQLGRLYTNINAPAYEAERGRQFQAQGMLPGLELSNRGQQLNALGMLPQFDTQSYYGLGQLAQGGGVTEQLQREQNMDPWNRLNLYGQNVTGQYGGTTTGPGQSPFDKWLGRGSQMATIATPFVLEN